MPLSARWLLVVALLAGAGHARAQAEQYRLDPVHTRVLFFIDHAGLSRAIGSFSGVQGSLRFDPDDWSTAALDVTLPLSTLDIGDQRWRDKVLEGSFLDAGKQPLARFVSSRVEPGADGTARVIGQLSLRGVSREVTLDVRLNALKRHPLTFRHTAGFSASARLSRRDFGITAWPNVIGDEVELLIEAEAIRGRAETSPTPTEPRDADQE